MLDCPVLGVVEGAAGDDGRWDVDGREGVRPSEGLRVRVVGLVEDILEERVGEEIALTLERLEHGERPRAFSVRRAVGTLSRDGSNEAALEARRRLDRRIAPDDRANLAVDEEGQPAFPVLHGDTLPALA